MGVALKLDPYVPEGRNCSKLRKGPLSYKKWGGGWVEQKVQSLNLEISHRRSLQTRWENLVVSTLVFRFLILPKIENFAPELCIVII